MQDGFYSKPSMKCSLKIALAIATSAATIKAEEICSSESCEKQLKLRWVKKEKEGKQSCYGNRAGKHALLPGRGLGGVKWVPRSGELEGANPFPAPSSQHKREGEL